MSLRKYIKNTANPAFSIYTRIKAADQYGYCTCITCGKREHWKDMDGGHYITRYYWPTLFDERNDHPQCRKCNRYLEGAKPEYSKYMLKRYGQEVIDELILKSHMTKTFTLFELKDWVAVWREEIKKMSIVKNL